jgi:hypothetical protein
MRRGGERLRFGGGAHRDQRESAFAKILASFVSRVPGAHAAALVDSEGETVDYAGDATPFDLRVAAAHWRIVLDEAAAQASMRPMRLLIVRAARKSYVATTLPDGYALVVVLARCAGFSGYERALSVCTLALGQEAGWTWDSVPKPLAWFPVDVVSDPTHRPRAVRDGDRLRHLEILGAIANRNENRSSSGGIARPRDRGWRVRVDTGLEAMLVREPGGTWYSDEPVARAREGSGGTGVAGAGDPEARPKQMR